MKIGVGALMSAGTGKRVLFSYLPNVRKGGNLIATMLFTFLLWLKTSGLPAALAPVLNLNVDGGSENCNWSAFAKE